MTITDEMVGLAEIAYDTAIDEQTEGCDAGALRAALEAVAPMLIARLIEEREALLGENARLVGIIHFMTAANAMQAEDRAQELDPK